MSPRAPGRAVTVRRMTPADVPRVTELEVASFTCPWSAESFEALVDRERCYSWVLQDGEEGVVGYAVLWCIMDQGELANFAVAPTLRGQGLGAHLLAHVLDDARAQGVERVYLEVRVSNEAARALYRSFGFSEVARRKRYYDKPVEDALVLRLEL